MTEEEDEKKRCEKWVMDAEQLHASPTEVIVQLLAQVRTVMLPEIRNMEKSVEKHKNEHEKLVELRIRLGRVLEAIDDAETEIDAEKDQLS